jgi:hypothetical protein
MQGPEIVHGEAASLKANENRSSVSEGAVPETCPDEIEFSPLISAGELSRIAERFSDISRDLTENLSRLSMAVKNSEEKLKQVRAAVDAKKQELRTLRGIEATAIALERLVLDHQRQKETLDRIIAEQRAVWEAEKTNRDREETEYLENLRIRRAREEEEYRRMWAAEKLSAQNKLEEELAAIRQGNLQKQQEMERDCLERELRLKEKESEWVQLVGELEQFMAKLAQRAKGQTIAHPGFASPKDLYPKVDVDFALNETPTTEVDSGFGNAFSPKPGPGTT